MTRQATGWRIAFNDFEIAFYWLAAILCIGFNIITAGLFGWAASYSAPAPLTLLATFGFAALVIAKVALLVWIGDTLDRPLHHICGVAAIACLMAISAACTLEFLAPSGVKPMSIFEAGHAIFTFYAKLITELAFSIDVIAAALPAIAALGLEFMVSLSVFVLRKVRGAA